MFAHLQLGIVHQQCSSTVLTCQIKEISFVGSENVRLTFERDLFFTIQIRVEALELARARTIVKIKLYIQVNCVVDLH